MIPKMANSAATQEPKDGKLRKSTVVGVFQDYGLLTMQLTEGAAVTRAFASGSLVLKSKDSIALKGLLNLQNVEARNLWLFVHMALSKIELLSHSLNVCSAGSLLQSFRRGGGIGL